jgi:prevent-host-death family protein
MDLKSNIRPISYVKTNAADMLKQINDTRNPIIITQNGEARAVLIDPDSYQELINSLGLLKLLAQGERDIELGRIVEHSDLMSSVRSDLNASSK